MFGKIISQAENPSFSGTFYLFVVIRMLKVKKRYEIWLVMQVATIMQEKVTSMVVDATHS
ncbi:hypothetical protein YC2023_115028 [Brassica napus]